MSAVGSLLLGLLLLASLVMPPLAPFGIGYLLYVFLRDLAPRCSHPPLAPPAPLTPPAPPVHPDAGPLWPPWEPLTAPGKARRARQLAYRQAHGLPLTDDERRFSRSQGVCL